LNNGFQRGIKTIVSMNFALLQLNMTVGDLESNAGKILAAVKSAKQRGAQFCVTSEMALTGYPQRDLLLDGAFIEKAKDRLQILARDLKDTLPVLVGTVDRNETGVGKPLFNAAILLHEGKIKEKFHKTLLPTYDVFDEARYFEPGLAPGFLEFAGVSIAVTICEDLWNDAAFWKERLYANDPLEKIAAKGADVIVNLSASPFTIGKQRVRHEMLSSVAGKHKTWVLYANQVGGNDDLVFPGRSMAFGPSGELTARGRAFEEDVVLVDTGLGSGEISSDDFSPESEAWRALLLGTRDYIQKCGFKKALVGLSGGIDSSLTAAVAAKAVGPENVLGVLMPSPYSSAGSVDHSLELAKNLGIQTMRLPIEEIMRAYDKTLEPAFEGYVPDVTEENIQARIRGNLLMALSNKYGAMLLTTGNKSESAVGYCTLYGDMSGGLAVISDVPKALVYGIARWLNEKQGRIIPLAVIEKAPSAELRPGQLDQDSLPPYDILDAVLERLVVKRESAREIQAAGFDRDVVREVARLVKAAEFKRRQAAPGIKITDRAFGTGWRMPLASKFDF